MANSISHYIQLTGDPESVNRVYQLYDQITPADILGAAKYLTRNNHHSFSSRRAHNEDVRIDTGGSVAITAVPQSSPPRVAPP